MTNRKKKPKDSEAPRSEARVETCLGSKQKIKREGRVEDRCQNKYTGGGTLEKEKHRKPETSVRGKAGKGPGSEDLVIKIQQKN